MNFVLIFCLLCIFGHKASGNTDTPARPIQIMVPIKQEFKLKFEELRPILEDETIKDRHVVVVSIAGAFRQGKSFLSNFFLKYLRAQYKNHDISDWIGEKSNGIDLDGFKWRAGRKRETVGIWMWSEIFTHDYANGEKVAIILLDTQGIFDQQTSKRLFTEYGRLALKQTNEKPFQKLFFIVRDWLHANETEYGVNGQKIIDEILALTDDQKPEMRQLRERIQSSFETISAFLMPSPGTTVTQGTEFTGSLQQIDPAFITYVKLLVPMLFAPENLIVKKVNGQNLRAQDLLPYLKAYVTTFNSADTIPEPKSILMATAEASNLILHNDCVKSYTDSMRGAAGQVVPYLEENELRKLHLKAKGEAVTKFLEKPKLGGAEMASSFQRKIEDDTEEKYLFFKSENDGKRQVFIEQANFHNSNKTREIYEDVKTKMLDELNQPNASLTYYHLSTVFLTAKENAFDEFNATKMGDETISKGFRRKLEQDLNEYQSLMSITVEAFHLCLQFYSDKMQSSLNDVEFFSALELTKLHQSVKNEAIAQFRSKPGDYGLKFKIEPKIEQLPVYEKQNEERRLHSEKKSSLHVEQINNQILEKSKNRIIEELNQPDSILTYSHLSSVFLAAKQSAIEELGSTQTGDEHKLNAFRDMLSLTLEAYHISLQFYNDKMQESLNGVEYFSPFDLTKTHQSVKNEAISQFRSKPLDFGLKFNLQWRIEKNVDEKFTIFERQNDEKRKNFMEKVSWHSETVKKEGIESTTPVPAIAAAPVETEVAPAPETTPAPEIAPVPEVTPAPEIAPVPEVAPAPAA